MNKFEVSEIKKNFTYENPFLTVNRISVAIVDGEGNEISVILSLGCLTTSVQIFENLKYTFQTKNSVVVFASSGTGAMDAAVTNFLCKTYL